MPKKSIIKKNTAPVRPTPASYINLKMGLLAGAIAIFTLFSFSPVLKNSFINWDDNAYVFENKHLDKPLSESATYFFGPHYFIGNYIPLTMIAYALEYHSAGLEPKFFHSVNILIHLLNVILVFWFIYLLSGKKPLVATLVALFFGIHPMHVESVAWVAELKDVLFTFFFIPGLIAYYKYLERKTNDQYITKPETKEQAPVKKTDVYKPLGLALLLFVLSILSKPAAVTFPVVLLLIDFYNRRKFDKWVYLEKAPFFLLSVIFGIVAVKAQQADRLLHDYYPLYQRFFFACHSLTDYLIKLFFPFNLSIFYPYPQTVNGRLPYFYYVAPAIVILLFYGVYRSLKSGRLIAFGALFFFANIILILQLLSIGDAIMADRYTYIPYIGLFFIIAMGFDRLYNSQKFKAYRSVATGLIILLAITSSYFTYARCGVWENNDSIANDLIEKFPNDRLVLNNKAYLLFEEKRYEESIRLFNKAIQVRPDYIMAYINLINSYIALNNYDHALKTADTALTYAPKDFNLLTTKGYLLFRQNKYTEAIGFLKDAIRIKNDNINSYLCLAECYYVLHDYTTELSTLEAGLKQEPDNYILLNNKGYTLFVMKRYEEALGYFKASLKIKPDYRIALVNLSDCNKAITDSIQKKN